MPAIPAARHSAVSLAVSWGQDGVSEKSKGFVNCRFAALNDHNQVLLDDLNPKEALESLQIRVP